MGVYSKDDLFTLWLNFRGQSNELQMMEDFGLCSKDEAQALIDDFETRLEVETLDGSHRGKADREPIEYIVPKRKRGRPPKVNPDHLRELLETRPPTGGVPDTPLISRLTAAEIVKQAMEAAKVK